MALPKRGCSGGVIQGRECWCAGRGRRPRRWAGSSPRSLKELARCLTYLFPLSFALLERCDQRDLLVDFEDFHTIAVARRECGLMLDTESFVHLAGCPGSRMIAQGPGHVVVEAIDAPWAGVSAWIRGSSELGVSDRVFVGGCG